MTEAAEAVADALTKRSLANRSGAKSAATKHFPAPPPHRSEAAPLVDQPSAEPVSTTLEGQPEPRLCPVSRRYGAPISPVASERQSALWQLWRLIGMPIFYPLFAVGCCVGLLGAAGIRLVVRVPAARVRANRRLLSAISRQWLRFGCWLRLLEWEALRPAGSDAATVKTADAAPGDQTPGRLLVANHPTLIDILFMVSLEPELCCVLKADLNDHWVFALFIRELDYLSNADPERLLAEGAERLLSGETLLVFPEGTRTVPGQSVSFRQGAAALAVRAGLPVQPVVIEYQGAYLSKGFPWYALPKQRLRYRFRFGGPLHGRPTASGDTTAARSARRQARRQLNATLEQFMNQQLLASTLPAPSRTGMSSEQPLTPLRGADL